MAEEKLWDMIGDDPDLKNVFKRLKKR
jgi:hypothetical protein